MGRTMRDVALLLRVIAGPDPRAALVLDTPRTPFLDGTEGALRFHRRRLPLGWQLIGRPRDERGLLRIAAAFEAATGHWRPEPQLVLLPG